ncbi:MAG: hypothetical protein PHX14_10275 [Syntrophomonadaceae bacterium]|nr:hypothetical protein [Syntrophomonadaceae bacterium]
MNRKTLLFVGLLALTALILFFFPRQNQTPPPTSNIQYINDKYGFVLELEAEFKKNVEIREAGRTIYFISRDIQAKQPETIFGVVGRIEIYSKAESTKETLMQAGDAYGLKYLGENEAYYFGWAHASDVQIPPGDESLAKEFRALEMKFDDAIKTFETKKVSPLEVKIDSGRYVGLADSNFFEVKISGVPDEIAAKVFMISDKNRAKFEGLNLQTGEEIKINYIQNEHGQNVVQDIEKL